MKKLFTLIILFLLITGLCYPNGIIKGIVTDKKSGEPLVGATVHIKNKKTALKITSSTGLDGSFTFRNVPPGEYEVEAKFISYKDESKTALVKNGGTTIINLQLEAKGGELKEVLVGGRNLESDQSANKLQQRAAQVLNAVSARTIEVSPDITVANVLQRVSGLTIQRSNNGEGQYALIRGMEKRYTYTLVDGYKIPSPDNKNRYIPLDIFPSDIVSRLEVYKSLIPALEGDAIAGAINLVLKEAPDNFTVSANLGVGLSQSVADYGFTKFGNNNVSLRSPRIINGSDYNANISDFTNNGQHFTNSKLPIGTIGGLSIGGRTANKKLGALLSLSYQNIYKTTESVFFASDVDVNNSPVITDIQRRYYNTSQERISTIGRFDYKFNSRNKLNFNGAYINLDQNQFRFNSDTSLTLGRTGIGQGKVTQNPRSQRDVQKIYNLSLHGENILSDKLSINYTGLYSKATANENRYDLSLITANTFQANGTVIQAATTVDALRGQTQTFSYNSDQDKSGYLNIVYQPVIFSTKIEITGGGMYRNKTRSSTYDQYTLGLPLTNSTQNYDGNIDHNTFAVSTLQGTASDPLNYDFTENVTAGYAQLKFRINKLDILGGARYEHTDEGYYDALPATQAGKTGSIKYYDILPSLNLKYAISDKQNLRASYYFAISRPNFYEIVPHTTGDPDADYQEIGNPNIKHATADNYDLRYEFFPKALDQFLLGVFYKRIVNPIEYALINQNVAGSSGFVLQATNFSTANNYGLEADVTKYIHNFGFRANYTYTNSDITTSKAERYRDASGNITARTVSQKRPLQGQSKNVGNLSLLYKDVKNGLDAQISAVYTGERINSVSAYLNNDIWQKGFVTLDFSAEKKLLKGLFVYAKVTNLSNTPYQLFVKLPYPPAGPIGSTGQPVEYQESGKNTFIRKDVYQQYYILGLHYKFI